MKIRNLYDVHILKKRSKEIETIERQRHKAGFLGTLGAGKSFHSKEEYVRDLICGCIYDYILYQESLDQKPLHGRTNSLLDNISVSIAPASN